VEVSWLECLDSGTSVLTVSKHMKGCSMQFWKNRSQCFHTLPTIHLPKGQGMEAVGIMWFGGSGCRILIHLAVNMQPEGRLQRLNSKPVTGSVPVFLPKPHIMGLIPGQWGWDLWLPQHPLMLLSSPLLKILYRTTLDPLPLLTNSCGHFPHRLCSRVSQVSLAMSVSCFQTPRLSQSQTTDLLSRWCPPRRGSDRMPFFTEVSLPSWSHYYLINPHTGLKACGRCGIIL
jgi:hypothetical protein